MQLLHQAYYYLQHLLQAKDEHSLHSPFLFDFYSQVVLDKNPFYVFDEIEGIRSILLKSNKRINVIDLGAGGNKLNSRRVSDIAAKSLKSPELAQLLYRIINYQKPQTIIELGTSLGITTLYLASNNKKSKVVTFEGSPEIAELAKLNFKQLNLSNIEVVIGNMDNTLSAKLNQLKEIDFAFIDGNHRYAPTLNYFNQILNYTKPDSILVFDDIYWSKEMTLAWNEIKKHPKVTATVDLYYLGVVFLNPTLTKQHHKLKF